MDDTEVKHVAYPLGGGITELGHQLKEIIHDLDVAPNKSVFEAGEPPTEVSSIEKTKYRKSLLPGLALDKKSGWIVSLRHTDAKASKPVQSFNAGSSYSACGLTCMRFTMTMGSSLDSANTSIAARLSSVISR